MTGGLRDVFRSTAGFQERQDGGFGIEGLNFEGTVTVEEDGVRLTQELPMLDTVVDNETVAPVVESGWAETFKRRAVDVTNLSSVPQTEPSIEIGDRSIVVTIRVGSNDIDPDGLTHAANFVEGVWVEGIIPGYEYDKQIQAIRERAANTGGTE